MFFNILTCRSKFSMRLVITFHTLLLFSTILALQPKILLIIEGTEETNFVSFVTDAA
jgi:hypothetical protein